MILIDDREGSKQLHPLMPKGSSKLTRMEYGDVAFTGCGPDDSELKVGIEIKKFREFAGAVTSGRLAGHQLPGMVEHYDRVYVLVVGHGEKSVRYEGVTNSHMFTHPRRRDGKVEFVPLKDGSTTPFTDAALSSFVMSMEEFFGVRYIYVTDMNRCARKIWMMWNWWNKDYDAHTTQGVIYNSASAGWTGRVNPMTKIAACIPGIGGKKAKAVSKEFDSLKDMIDAGAGRWSSVDGISYKTGMKILKFLRNGEEG